MHHPQLVLVTQDSIDKAAGTLEVFLFWKMFNIWVSVSYWPSSLHFTYYSYIICRCVSSQNIFQILIVICLLFCEFKETCAFQMSFILNCVLTVCWKSSVYHGSPAPWFNHSGSNQLPSEGIFLCSVSSMKLLFTKRDALKERSLSSELSDVEISSW